LLPAIQNYCSVGAGKSGGNSYSLNARKRPTIAITQATTGIHDAALQEAEKYQNASKSMSGTSIAAVELMTELSRYQGSAKTTIATMMM